jgi:hypothetical protein
MAPELGPDSLPGDLAPGGAQADVTRMIGFLGESDREDHVRFYVDRELKLWFDIPNEHVERRLRAADDTGDERTVIWIDRAWMRRPLFDTEAINSMAGSFLMGQYAMSSALPETVEAAIDEASRRTTYHQTKMCTVAYCG